MPAPLVDVLAVGALLVMLVVAFVHPPPWVELLVGLLCAGAVVAVGAVDAAGALDQVRLLLPVVAFLAGILVVAELCAAEGVFAAVGGLVARASRGDPRRMLTLTFVARVPDHRRAQPGRDRGAADPRGRGRRHQHPGQPPAGGLRLRPAGQHRLPAAPGVQPDEPAGPAVAALALLPRLRRADGAGLAGRHRRGVRRPPAVLRPRPRRTAAADRPDAGRRPAAWCRSSWWG